MKKARDLFLLSTIAFRQGKHQDSALLFNAAMASDDADQFLNLLNEDNTVTASSLSSLRNIEHNLSSAVESFANGLSLSAEDEEILQPESTEGSEDEDFDDYNFDSDDMSTEFPGEKILPPSISSAGPKIIISTALKSPVKIKA